jgi:predicted aconitase
VLGYLVGREVGSKVPVLKGLPQSTTEDQLKAFGAAVASSGAVALFHAVGVTPEANSLQQALQGNEPERIVEVTPGMLAQARDSLSTAPGGRIAAVSLGTPHFSVSEFETLMPLLEETGRVHRDVELYVSTGRHVLAQLGERGWVETLERVGIKMVTDTCTYVTSIIGARSPEMTNSAKWAYYAPANIGVDGVFGSIKECVRSAATGELWRDKDLWGDAC